MIIEEYDQLELSETRSHYFGMSFKAHLSKITESKLTTLHLHNAVQMKSANFVLNSVNTKLKFLGSQIPLNTSAGQNLEPSALMQVKTEIGFV